MKTNLVLIAITATFTLVLSINPLSYAFHENLGIDDNKASELYHSNPNDPAIVQWKSALQSAINDMDMCFIIETAILCEDLIPTIISNCVSHPNTLLACNDSRFPQYATFLKQAEEAQKKAEEEKKKADSTKFPQYAENAIEMCFSNTNSNTTFQVAGLACDIEMRSLQTECQLANNTYNYCKDGQFVGYLAQHNITNSTTSPYSNLTGNSSSSNSTYP